MVTQDVMYGVQDVKMVTYDVMCGDTGCQVYTSVGLCDFRFLKWYIKCLSS